LVTFFVAMTKKVTIKIHLKEAHFRSKINLRG